MGCDEDILKFDDDDDHMTMNIRFDLCVNYDKGVIFLKRQMLDIRYNFRNPLHLKIYQELQKKSVSQAPLSSRSLGHALS